MAIDRNFVSAYIAIASDHVFSGRSEVARKGLARRTRVARNGSERREALAWPRNRSSRRGAWSRAVAEIGKRVVGAGDAGHAPAAIRKAAEWNALSLRYGLVRANKARALAGG